MSNQSQAGPAVNPYDVYDREIKPKSDAPVAVCRVRVPGKELPHNSPGDRISEDPQKARWLERNGNVVVEIASVRPSAIRAAGGVDAYLKTNPKADKLSEAARKKLVPIPGLPDPNRPSPWDFE